MQHRMSKTRSKRSEPFDWDVSPKAAIEQQKALCWRVSTHTGGIAPAYVAGVDVGFKSGYAYAAIAVLSYPSLKLVDTSFSVRTISYPYVPGLLSYREGPVILDAIEKVGRYPDVFIFDGQGTAHPRRIGIASHIGVLLDHPTIGCAKSRLCGTHAPVDSSRGSHTALIDRGETIGAVLRSRTGVRPLFISPGHRIDLPASIDIVLHCCTRYRLPETTRYAHRLAQQHTVEIK
jgi:deoxyribonuclease V